MSTDLLSSVALGCIAAYAVVALGVRSLVQWRRTGSSGWRGAHGRPGSKEWWAGVLLVIGGLGLVVAPLVRRLVPGPEADPLRLWIGVVVFVAGFVLTVAAQASMGDAWRIGVQKGERTELRTAGLFAWCRNPIFTGMLITGVGIAVMVPWASIAVLVLWLGLALQVRVVEEPHLLAVHGNAYRDYAARVGRFLPRLGRGVGEP